MVAKIRMTDSHFVHLGRIIRNIDFFEDMALGDIDKICKELTLYRYDPREKVFKEGDPGKGFYIVCKGVIQISAKRGLFRTGQMLALLKEGQFFGEMALVGHAPRNASAVAIEKTLLYRLDREAFDALIELNPHFQLAIDSIVKRRERDRTMKLHRDL